MEKIQGFDKARRLLTRESSWEFFTASDVMAAQIKQVFGKELSLQEVVDFIVGEVRDEGDKALFDYTEKLDGVRLDTLEVSRQEIVEACKAADKELITALEVAAERIRGFHLACKHKDIVAHIDKHLGRQVLPLDRAGLYIPGGTAAYPSTVLMMAIPANVAGVKEIIAVSPPGKDGKIPASTLLAANIAQVDRVFKLGGAQAIAALAFGTKSIPRVDKICGPGNIFVTLAKKKVYGMVAIDGLEGPSEIVIVADEKADPAFCAADLLAQAEHDSLALVVLITTSAELLEQVDREIKIQLKELRRYPIAKGAIDTGKLVLVNDIDEAIELVNLFAPEHLSLMISNASSFVPRICNAGCIFVGENSPVAMGDYIAGPSHVLPTGGSARFSSPLGVEDFLKITNIIALDKPAMQELGQSATIIAKAEGLDAHARAISLRVVAGEKKQSQPFSDI